MGFIDVVCVLSFLIYISCCLAPGIIPIGAFRTIGVPNHDLLRSCAGATAQP